MIRQKEFAKNNLKKLHCSIADKFFCMYAQCIEEKICKTYNHPRTTGIAGTPQASASVLQSRMKYARRSKKRRENVQQYHNETPIRLRWRTPTISVTNTYMPILEPPATTHVSQLKLLWISFDGKERVREVDGVREQEEPPRRMATVKFLFPLCPLEGEAEERVEVWKG